MIADIPVVVSALTFFGNITFSNTELQNVTVGRVLLQRTIRIENIFFKPLEIFSSFNVAASCQVQLVNTPIMMPNFDISSTLKLDALMMVADIFIRSGGYLLLPPHYSLQLQTVYMRDNSALSSVVPKNCKFHIDGRARIENLGSLMSLNRFELTHDAELTVNSEFNVDERSKLEIGIQYNSTTLWSSKIIAANTSKISSMEIKFADVPYSWDNLTRLNTDFNPFVNTVRMDTDFEVSDNTNGIVMTTNQHSGDTLLSLKFEKGYCSSGCINGECRGALGCVCYTHQYEGERCDTTVTIPLAPYDISINAQQDRTITISWREYEVDTARINYCSLYKFGNMILVTSSPTLSFQFNDQNVEPGVLYNYTIDCTNSYGRGRSSTPQIVRAQGAPTSPNFTVIDVGMTFITVNISTLAYPSVTKINVMRDKQLLESITATDSFTIYNDTSVFTGTRYRYSFQAINTIGKSSYSDIQLVYTLAVPGAMGGQSTFDPSKGLVQMQWYEPTNKGNPAKILGYRLRKNGTVVRHYTSDTELYEETIHEYGFYFYSICAYNEVGEGPANHFDFEYKPKSKDLTGLIVGLSVGGAAAVLL